MTPATRDLCIATGVITVLAVVTYFLIPDRLDFIALPMVVHAWCVGVLCALVARLLSR